MKDLTRRHDQDMYISLWVLWPIAMLFLTTRFYVRTLRRKVGADDYCMLAACIIYTLNVALETVALSKGTLKHIALIPPHRLEWLLKFNAVQEVFAILGLALGKTAVGLLFPRIIWNYHKHIRWTIGINVTIYNLISLMCIIFAFAACDPPKARWHPELIKEGKANCNLSYVHVDLTTLLGAFGAFLDFLMALMPIGIVWKLKMALRKKVGTCVLLGLGVFAGICSVIKTFKFQEAYGSKDPTYDSFGLIFWTSLELPFIIIAGCVAPSVPLFDSLFGTQPIVEGRQPLSYSLRSLLPTRSRSQATSQITRDSTDEKGNSVDELVEPSSRFVMAIAGGHVNHHEERHPHKGFQNETDSQV